MQAAGILLRTFILIGFCNVMPGEWVAVQYPGFKPVEDMAAFREDFASAAAKVTSIEGEFTQEKELTALTEKITSHGKLWFKRENKVRMDYADPFAYSMIINGEKMLIRDGQKVNQVNVGSSRLLRQVNRIMLDCMQGTILDNRDFSTRVFESDSAFLLEFTTLSKNLKQFFHSIILVVEKKDNAPRSIQLNEPSGDKTLITLHRKTVNGLLSDEVFSL
jgi:outer membrane lipoprotein-sorting protein